MSWLFFTPMGKTLRLYNQAPVDDFFGLSPEQMHLMLYAPLEQIEHILTFDPTCRPELLRDVPVVDDTMALLTALGTDGVKATAKGFLPKGIVDALHRKQVERVWPGHKYGVVSEQDALEVYALRRNLVGCGWMKLRNRRFSLTEKGRAMLQRDFQPLDYVSLFKFWLRKYNWAFADGYPELPFIQQSAIYLLYAIKMKGSDGVSLEDFTQSYLRAFPVVLSQIEADPWERSKESIVLNMLDVRFIERFCGYFGLVMLDTAALQERKTRRIEVTPLFHELLQWFSAEKQKSPLTQGLSGYLH